MDIGKEKRTIIVEPARSPIPQEQPTERPRRTVPRKDPVEAPDAPVKVPEKAPGK